MDVKDREWIGPAPSIGQIAAILFGSTMVPLASALQPILLGGLVAEQRLTTVQLGQAATVELLAIAVMSIFAGAVFKPQRVRTIALLAGAAFAAANVATMALSGYQILLARAVAGLSCGVYIWILVSMLTRSHNAARYIGMLGVIQGFMALGLSSLFVAAVVPRFGINGGYCSLALMALVLTAASRIFPDRFEPLPSQAQGGRLPPPRGLAALLMAFLYMGGVIGVWVYAGAMSQQAGHSAAATGLAFSISFAAQIAGGALASFAGNRIPAMVMVTAGGVGSFALALLLATGPGVLIFTIALSLFGMLWMFATAYTIPLIFVLDPSRKSGLYATSAQLLGGAAGPAVGALLIVGADVHRSIIGTGSLILLAVLIAVVAQRTGRQRAGEGEVGATG